MSASSDVCKLVLVGNGSVGKTSICQRFIANGFQKVYNQTLGLEWYDKKVQIRDRILTLQVWDIGGQSISSKMLNKYFFGANVVFLCYDVTDPQSFADVSDWLAMAKRPFQVSAPGERPRVPQMFLVGNKIDLQHLRRVPESDHDKFIAENELAGGFFVSARTGDQLTRTFYDAAGKSIGMSLSEYELSFFDRVVAAEVTVGDENEGKTGIRYCAIYTLPHYPPSLPLCLVDRPYRVC